VIDPNNGCIWERGTIQDLAPDDPVSQGCCVDPKLRSGDIGCFWLSDLIRWGALGTLLAGIMLMALGFIGLVILGPVVLVRTEVVSALARVGRT